MITIIYVALGVIGLFVLAVVMYLAWFHWQTRPRRPKEKGYQYVWVEEDGSAREVTADERKYLETEFLPGDGARPYIKLRYETLNGRGSIAGYLPRRQLPKNIAIAQAPWQKDDKYQ
jgi:hypothetical protein